MVLVFWVLSRVSPPPKDIIAKGSEVPPLSAALIPVISRKGGQVVERACRVERIRVKGQKVCRSVRDRGRDSETKAARQDREIGKAKITACLTDRKACMQREGGR
jgi:hypothetical protein